VTHGTRSCYQVDRCRCVACRAAEAIYRATLRKRKVKGLPPVGKVVRDVVSAGANPVLTPKEARFVAEYPIDLNGAAAAVRAGYAPKSAKVTASRLLKKPADQGGAPRQGHAHVSRRRATNLTAARVLEELRRWRFGDIRALFDAHGNLKPLSTLTEEQASCIGGFEVLIKNAKAGDGVTDTIHKFKLWDKPKALEMLAKHFALLVDASKSPTRPACSTRSRGARPREKK
jgi:phage terminase small subunit